MGNRIPERSEIPAEQCWDLTPLYADAGAWEKDFQRLDELVQNFLNYRGRLHESPEILRDAFRAEDELGLLMERLHIYAGLRHDENTTDSANTARENRIAAKSAEISGKTAWFEPELMAVPKETFDLFRNSPVLAFYKRTLDETERERAHTLSEPEERILGMSADALSTAGNIFGILNDGDLRFPKISDGHGNKVELTHGNYISYLEDKNRRVRRAAFSACYDTYKSFANTFAAILDGTVKTGVLEAKLRGFPSARAAALYGDNIPLSVYDNLIETVHENLPSFHRYFKLRAKTMGRKKLDMYDIMNPIVRPPQEKYPWETSVQLVKDALRPLGETYCTILESAFTDRWIDIRENRGKRSGAYSSGVYRTPPYLLLNHAGNLDSVFTLAHELGHSMHSYFSDQAQEYHYAGYRIFAAEVASTTNELLLFYSMKKKAETKAEKAYLVHHLLNTIRGTAFRQTMFAEFERDIYAWCESGTPLTEQALSDRYFELNRQYHGDAVCADERIRYEWARIPHFHYGFYVYKYATGISAAAALAQDILNGKTDRYMGFLKAGDSKDVMDILKDAGVDFTTPAPVAACMKMFDNAVGELELLMNGSN